MSKSAVQWSLMCLDKTDLLITSDFKFDELSITGTGAQYAEIKSLLMSYPYHQWILPNSIHYSFPYVARTEGYDSNAIDKQWNQLQQATKKIEALGRPYYWAFVYGKYVVKPVVVEAIDTMGVTLRGDGTARQVKATIRLLAVNPVVVETTAPTHNTVYAIVRNGDTYHTIAQHHYGDAAMGVKLAEFNDMPWLVAGDIIMVPESDTLRAYPDGPYSDALRDDAYWLRKQAFDSVKLLS